ncbi:hypothetical protein V6R21_27065 [Limibacter armeniacum]|uniref:hypothetical protein n=1 Tax=Limibacter armeniacum TaxID=466084 RepID=UPI002FE63C72
MNIKEIEAKLKELKAKQGDYFKQKKADRNPADVEAIRKEMAELKEQAKAVYRKSAK